MYVQVELGVPDLVHALDQRPSFLLSEGVPVAVDIVTGIVMVQERRIRSRPRGVDGFLVPRLHRVDSVRVDCRDDEDDGLATYKRLRRSGRCCQPVGKSHRG